MIKHIVLLLNMLGILTFNSIFTNDVNIRTNIPAEVDAGGSFTVEIIISKGDLDKFARFKMDLPPAFKASSKETANGEFSFEEQSVVFFWIKLPYEEEFSISFDVQVPSIASGDFDLEGTFSYIEDNQRETITMAPHTITVRSGDYAAASQEEDAITFSYGNITERGISCIRQKPYLVDNDEIIVNLLVNKGKINKFGKIVETIPIGYRAENIRGKNSNFTFSNHEVKYAWLDLPLDEQFVVSYRLIPEKDLSDQAFIISGVFSYIGNEQLKEVEIVQRDIDLDSFSPEGLVADISDETQSEPDDVLIIESEKPDDSETEPIDTKEDIVTTEKDESDIIVEEIKPDETKILAEKTEDKPEEEIKPVIKDVPPVKDSKYVEKDTEPTLVSIPEPETGVSYRVQIAAGHKLVNPQYFKKLNVHDEVRVEIHDGWHKYTVGAFRLYKDARNYRIHLWNTTPIDDAFVAAYNYGSRITVQEALMIANQKWYK